MSSKVPHTPAGYHTVTPYVIVHDAKQAIAFYQQAFGATEVLRLSAPDGSIGHAEIQIGDSRIMLADEMPEMGIRSPKTIGGSATSLMVYVPDVDGLFEQAIAAGGTVLRPVADQFYGDRSGTLEDPFGHSWTLATHKENLSHDTVQERFMSMFQDAGQDSDKD